MDQQKAELMEKVKKFIIECDDVEKLTNIHKILMKIDKETENFVKLKEELAKERLKEEVAELKKDKEFWMKKSIELYEQLPKSDFDSGDDD